jgi:phospholipase C
MQRRDALKTIAGIAGAAGLSRILPGCSDSASGGPKGITTYVYMMMENRSYDHLFGARSMFEGKPGNGPNPNVTLLDSADKPVGLWAPDKTNLCDLDPPHGWDSLRDSWNQGACDMFLKVHQRDHGNPTAIQPMQYLTRNEVPVSYALADAYTTCDRWFCSVMGPTWPNRFYWHTGQAFGQMVNTLPDQLSPSIYHRLAAKGIDWAYYYGNVPVVAVIKDLDVKPHIRRFSSFLADAAAGTLPPVVYIDPGFAVNDDHPPVHPVLGQALISSVYKALAASPQWPNILFVLTYDENGGFYDHVSPPTMPDALASTGFNQCGFRVPTMVMGPYVKQGYVSSVQYDHTSALRHLMNVFELDELTLRTAAATDLTDCLDTERLAKGDWAPPVEIPEVNVDDWPMSGECVGTFREHPILDWADTKPAELAGLDLRHEEADYQRTIVDFLRNPPKALAKS